MTRSRSPLATRDRSPLESSRSVTFTNLSAQAWNSCVPSVLAFDIGTLRCPRLRTHLDLRPHSLYFQVEQFCGVQTQNIAFRLLAQERDRRDRAGWVEIPVWPIGSKQQLGLGVDRIERRLKQFQVGLLQRLGGKIHLSNVFTWRASQ